MTDDRELFNMFSNPNQRKSNNMPYLFNGGQMEPDFNNFEKVFNSTQYFNPNASFPAIFAGIPPQGGINPYFPNNMGNGNLQNMNFGSQMPNDPKLYDNMAKNEDNPAFFPNNQFPNWMVGQNGMPNGIFGNTQQEFDNNFMKNKGGNYQNNNPEPLDQMKYGQKMENIENNINIEAYLKNLTRYF